VDDKPEVRMPNGRFGPGNKTGGRKRRADENEMLAVFDRAMPNGKKIAIVQKQVDKALHGNLESAKWLFAYYYGAPIQRSEHTGEGGNPLEVIFRYVNENDNKEEQNKE